jgi:hypothetical protein
LVPAAVFAEDIAALTELIKQAIKAPQTQMLDNVDVELADVMTRISLRIPAAQDVLSEPSKHFNDPAVLCDALIAFHTEIINLPSSRSGPILRSFAESP